MWAWLTGIPFIFWGIYATQKVHGLLSVLLLMVGVLFQAGLAVSAIHGAFLIRLAVYHKNLTSKNG
jgi:hypothetical protein